MQTRITSRRFDATDALKETVQSQVEGLGRYYDGIHDAHVVLEEDGSSEKRAEVVLQVYRNTLAASDTGPTHEVAVNACVRQLRRQVLRYKDKLRRVPQRAEAARP